MKVSDLSGPDLIYWASRANNPADPHHLSASFRR